LADTNYSDGEVIHLQHRIKELEACLDIVLRKTRIAPREMAVLRLLTTGFSNKEAGAKLGLSPKTVDWYRMQLLRKFGVRDVVRLTHCAFRLGIIR
jgi:DNA-binding NarL/FixJ family response regulator